MHVSGETLVVENTLSVGDGATVNGILTTSNIYNENEIVIQSKDTIRLIGSNIILDGAMEYNFSDDVVSIDAVLSVGGSIVCAKFDSVSEVDVDAPSVRFSSNVNVGGETLVVENTLSVGDGATVNGILTTSNIQSIDEMVFKSSNVRIDATKFTIGDAGFVFDSANNHIQIGANVTLDGSIDGQLTTSNISNTTRIDVDAPIVRFSSNVHVGGETLIVVWIIITVWSS